MEKLARLQRERARESRSNTKALLFQWDRNQEKVRVMDMCVCVRVVREVFIAFYRELAVRDRPVPERLKPLNHKYL